MLVYSLLYNLFYRYIFACRFYMKEEKSNKNVTFIDLLITRMFLTFRVTYV